ncbi:MAG: HYR domain-containing protein, partial [Flavobacteriales bacterium]|nr:HYR domain-containing protein [Flavobacteriales bacterium]
MNDRRTPFPLWRPMLRAGRCVFLCTLLLAGLCANGQPTTWDWAIGNNNGNNEQVRDIAVDTVNNAVYTTGTYDDAGPFGLGLTSGGTDGFLAKTDLNGNALWAVKIGGLFNDGCHGVAVGADGNIYITGSFNTAMTVNILGNLALLSSGQSDLFVACYAPTGSLQWVKTGGGVGDDIGYGIAVNSTGVFVQGTYKGGAAFGASTTPAGLNNGHVQAVLLKYSLTGNLLWRIDGTSTNKDQNAERIACDELGVYLTGTFGTNQMRWYNGGTLLTTINATGDPNIYVCAVHNDGTMNWAQAVSNPGDASINGNAIAVGCSMVYIAGSVHNGATFPSGTVISAAGSPHDYLYLAALNKSTGGTRWVRTMRDADDHMGVAYDLAVHANGSVFMCGSYEDNATFSDGTTIQTTGGGGYALDAFVARYTPYGQLSWATAANGSDDDVPLAIAVNKTSGIYTGGFFNDDLTFPPIAINSNANASLFLARLSDTPNAHWSQNPSSWTPPALVCANAGAVDLNTYVPTFSREYADLVTASTGVSDPNNIVGAPNGSVVLFSTDGSTLTADLTTTISPGNTFTIVWGKQAAFAGTASFQLETSPDNANWTTLTAPTIIAASTAFVNSAVQATAPTRYVRITKNNLLSAVNFKVDALKFFHGSLQGGTWTGTGVTSAGIFDPSALAGQSVSITYMVSNGTCPYSSTNSITIEPEPIGGSVTSSVIGTQCPGNNAGTLTLSGYLGTIVEWQASADNFASFTVLANTLATYSFNNLTQATSYRARVSNNCGTVLSASYTVQVGDNTAPVITTCPLPRTIYVGANCKAPIPDLLPSAAGADNCSATLTWTQFPVALSLVNKGIHVVVVTATDGAGNATTCNVTITARDTTPPVISGCLGNVTLSADPGKCSAVYNFIAPTATDNCGMVLSAITVIAIADVDGLAISVLNAPNEYPVGVTTRTFTFADASGNSSSCSFDITVIDDQWPTVVSCPGDITMPASPGLCGTAVNYAIPVFADNCSYLVERTQGAASGDFFPVGTTPVKHLATDSAGNSVSCTFNVIVQDGEAPVLTGCPSNFIVQAPLAGTGAVATWTPPIASDNCGAAAITQTVGQAPGSFLTLGAHVITYTATAPNGVTSTCTFTITVISNDAPTITCPANQVLYSTPFDCAQVFSYAIPPVGDDMALPAGQPVQIDGTGHTSGAPFPLGSTVQTWRVTDSNSNSTTCSFTVQVIDTIRPSFPSCPTNVTISAEPGECGAHYTYAVPAPTDNCPGVISVVQLLGPASGNLFPIGSTLVRHRAMDASGNTVRCQFYVTVVDDIFPTLSNCPAAITLAAEPNECGAHVTFTPPTAQDNCFATLTRTAGPPSGALFPIGDTSVEFTATDPQGNSVTCGFNVHVDDLTAPVFTYCPDTLTVASDPGQCGAVVNYASPFAEDNCIATLTPPTGQLSGAFFPVGSTAVSYTVTDGISNATCTFQIVVIDNEAPMMVGLPANISVSTDPSDSMSLVTWAAPTVSDNCAATIAADHASGDAFGIGTTPVTYTAMDAMHSISATFLVTVTDDEDPLITCPPNDTLEVDATCSVATPLYTAAATDNHTIDSIWQTEGPVPNDPLTLVSGPYYTKWAAVDSSGNITTCVQWIELIDVDAPVITCLWPAPIEL